MYKLTNGKTGESTYHKTLQEAELIRKANVSLTNMRYKEFGIGYKDSRKNYTIEEI